MGLRHLIVVVAALSVPGAEMASAGEANRLLSNFPAERQNAMMAEQVRSVDYPCSGVSRIFFKGETDGADYFAVRCEGGDDYMVTIQNTGGMRATITACAHMKVVGVECWTPF